MVRKAKGEFVRSCHPGAAACQPTNKRGSLVGEAELSDSPLPKIRSRGAQWVGEFPNHSASLNLGFCCDVMFLMFCCSF